MASSILLLFGAVFVWFVIGVVMGLRSNIAKARRSGLPYIINPWTHYFLPWQLVRGFVIPLVKKLPESWWRNWLFALDHGWAFYRGWGPAEHLGDSFLIVKPFGIMMYTRSAEVISQITSRREAFPKPLESYKLLQLYGENVVTTEGALWRMHRKVTSASFNEKNTAKMFSESIFQAQTFMAKWADQSANTDQPIRSLDEDTMLLALYIIGYVGFGLRFVRAGTRATDEEKRSRFFKYESPDPAAGHTMGFAKSLEEVLHYIIPIVAVPSFLMKNLPFESTKTALEAHENYRRYMYELVEDKLEDLRQGNRSDEGMDIMGHLVRTKLEEGQQAKIKAGHQAAKLDDSDIVGNAFIIMLAGHETTANTLHFTLIEMAVNPASQRRLQKDIDNIYGASDPATWDYETSINGLLASMAGACMNETLRFIPPVLDIPKSVSADHDQVITVDGEKHVLPKGMEIHVSAIGAQTNPRHWPPPGPGEPSDLRQYVPERWFRTAGVGPGGESGDDNEAAGGETEDFGGYQGTDTSAQLFRPPRGSYIPFSDGARSCLGRRIAQVEVVAVLAVIFQKYSVELAVDEYLDDHSGGPKAAVERMNRAERTAVYAQAQAAAVKAIASSKTVITMKLRGGSHVALRLVPRGKEQFVDWLDVPTPTGWSS